MTDQSTKGSGTNADTAQGNSRNMQVVLNTRKCT